jgi:Ca2+-binding RTX toxin-like protein
LFQWASARINRADRTIKGEWVLADIIGTAGNDSLIGTAVSDTIRTNGGVDTVDGGAGSDTIILDLGLLINAQSRWFITATNSTGTSGTIGQDTAVFNHHDLVTFTNVENINLSATGWLIVDGRLTAGTGSLTLNGNGTTDHLELSLRTYTAGVTFTINGTNASITNGTFTGFEQFTVYFGSGADIAHGGDNGDALFGLGGNDTLNGNGGADSLWGYDQNDQINGGEGNDYLYGGAGADTLIGGAGDDILYGHDEVSPDNNNSIDSVDGGDGNDKLVGGFGDTLIGGAGYDILTLDLSQGTTGVVLDLSAMFAGGTAANGGGTISGFEAWTTIAGTGGNDIITLGNGLRDPNGARAYSAFPGAVSGLGGDDTINGGGANDLFYGGEGNDTINGGDGDDNLQGENGNDTIRGDAGDDQIQGGAGLNKLYGGTGADRIDGGTGADELYGEDGDDIVQGNGGNDLLNGGAGNDQLYAYFTGNDTMHGGAGNDIFYNVDGSDTVTENVGEGIDTVVARVGTLTLGANIENLDLRFLGTYSGTGNQLDNVLLGGFSSGTLSGLGGNDTLEGASGTDTLLGGAGDDTLNGYAGDDLLDGGSGSDILTGDLGNDVYVVDSAADQVVENANGGTDTLVTSLDTYLSTYANLENLALSTGAGNIYGVGNDLANTITGNEGANLLIAGAGNDTVSGGAGNDQLFGEDGADTINGDAGIDYLAAGIGNDFLYGGGDADNLYGEDGDDWLDAGDSFHTDILTGGAGNDTLDGISGQANPDYDLLDGGSGDDVYWVDTGDDLTFEGIGGGTDTVHANVTVPNAGVYLYANVENLVLEGTTAFGVGNELNNQLTGSASGNWLLGGAGADIIAGMAGNDVLFGEGGADTFVFGAGSGQDVIGDFAAGSDKLDLSALFASFAEVQVNFVQNGANGAINLGGGNFVVLNGVDMSTLTATDFIFG